MAGVSLPALYIITDRLQTPGRRFESLLEEVLLEGVMLQLRERDLDARSLFCLARLAANLAESVRVPLLINDRIDIALAIGVGVHLRSSSLPTDRTRALVGDKLIGRSVHSAEEAVQADAEGADFVVLGPIYDTPSKRPYGSPLGLGILEEASKRCQIPVFAIGGMHPSRVPEVRGAGAYGVAVISAIWQAPDVQRAVKEFLAALHDTATH